MKKTLLFLITFCCVGLVGCSNEKKQVERNLSEVVEEYFFGKGEFFNVSISSGKREEPYQYDGKTREKVVFSVVTIFSDTQDEVIDAQIIIGEEEKNIMLTRDIISGAYMVDLETRVDHGDLVKVIYNREEINVYSQSKNFGISWKDALKIGVETFSKEINSLTYNNQLKAECYLRVLDDISGTFIKNYWHFYVYTIEGASYSCVIDVNSGQIVFKN